MTDTLPPRTLHPATNTRPPTGESRTRTWLRSNWVLLVLMAVGAAAAVAVRHGVFPFFSADYIEGITANRIRTYPPLLATVLRCFWQYVRLLALPFGLSADHGTRISTSFAEPRALLALSALLACTGLAVALRNTYRTAVDATTRDGGLQ